VFSARVIVMRSDVGELIAGGVHAPEVGGLRSIDHVGVLIGDTVRHGVITGRSGLSAQL
jgi:hypothetical protein